MANNITTLVNRYVRRGQPSDREVRQLHFNGKYLSGEMQEKLHRRLQKNWPEILLFPGGILASHR